MNTTFKGDQFEELSYNIIHDIIEREKLGVIPAYCKVHKKKGYYSKDREKEIIFDITIELWPPGAERYTLIYFIECKSYSSRVPVNDIEEFYAKVDQVSGKNSKGVFITDSSFQEGAYTFARSKGIMLIEVNDNITYNIILHKANRHEDKRLELLRKNKDEDSLLENFNQQLKRSIDKLLIQGFVEKLRKLNKEASRNKIQKLSAKNIEEMVYQLINSFDPTLIPNGRCFPLEKFIVFLKDVYGLEVIHTDITINDSVERKIISSCSFLDKCIKIDKSLLNTGRYSFILAHEIGHFLLHNKLQIDQDSYENFQDSQYNFYLDRYILQNERNWIEWQANQFASFLLMPEIPFIYRLVKFQEKIGLRGGSKIYVDDQPVNQRDFHFLTGNLASYFGTTKTNVIYRLNYYKLIIFNSKMKSIGEILRGMMNN